MILKKTYISDSLARFHFCLHPGKSVVIRCHIGEDGFLIRSVGVNVCREFGIRLTQ